MLNHFPIRGYEALFDEYYDELFRDTYTIKYYLTCYWLLRWVQSLTNRQTDSIERKRAKWLTLFNVYEDLHPTIKKRADIFIALSERENSYPSLAPVLRRLIDTRAASCARFYRVTKGKDGLPRDPTNFFKSQGLQDLFLEFWDDPKNRTLKSRYRNARVEFDREFEAAELL